MEIHGELVGGRSIRLLGRPPLLESCSETDEASASECTRRLSFLGVELDLSVTPFSVDLKSAWCVNQVDGARSSACRARSSRCCYWSLTRLGAVAAGPSLSDIPRW